MLSSLLKSIITGRRTIISSRISRVTRIIKPIFKERTGIAARSIPPSEAYVRCFQSLKAKGGNHHKRHEQDITYKQINREHACIFKGINASQYKAQDQNRSFYIHGNGDILINLCARNFFPIQKPLRKIRRFFYALMRKEPPVPKYCGKRVDQQGISPIPHSTCNYCGTSNRPKESLISIKFNFMKVKRIFNLQSVIGHSRHPFIYYFSNNLLISRFKWLIINHLFCCLRHLSHTRKASCFFQRGQRQVRVLLGT